MKLTQAQTRAVTLLGLTEKALYTCGKFEATDYGDLRGGDWATYPIAFCTICELQNKGLARIYGQKRRSLILVELTDLGKIECARLMGKEKDNE